MTQQTQQQMVRLQQQQTTVASWECPDAILYYMHQHQTTYMQQHGNNQTNM